jgi:hypothetical protein
MGAPKVRAGKGVKEEGVVAAMAVAVAVAVAIVGLYRLLLLDGTVRGTSIPQ